MVFYFYLSVLILILGAQIFLRSFVSKSCQSDDRQTDDKNSKFAKKAKLIFWLVFVFQIFWLVYGVRKQYLVWQADETAKYLLPPYQSVSYFLFYSYGRIISALVISFAAALLFLFLTQYLNRRFQERFFCPEEPYLGAIAILIVGHPLWLLYLMLIILTTLIGTFIKKIIPHVSCFKFQVSCQRFSPCHFWIPLAIFIIIINKLAVAHNWIWFLEIVKSWRIG